MPTFSIKEKNIPANGFDTLLKNIIAFGKKPIDLSEYSNEPKFSEKVKNTIIKCLTDQKYSTASAFFENEEVIKKIEEKDLKEIYKSAVKSENVKTIKLLIEKKGSIFLDVAGCEFCIMTGIKISYDHLSQDEVTNISKIESQMKESERLECRKEVLEAFKLMKEIREKINENKEQFDIDCFIESKQNICNTGIDKTDTEAVLSTVKKHYDANKAKYTEIPSYSFIEEIIKYLKEIYKHVKGKKDGQEIETEEMKKKVTFDIPNDLQKTLKDALKEDKSLDEHRKDKVSKLIKKTSKENSI